MCTPDPVRHRARARARVAGPSATTPTTYKNRNVDPIHAALLAEAAAIGVIDWSVSVDSTINRAHQHGTSLPRDAGGRGELHESARRTA